MTESVNSRRKRIAFRCRQRGMLETSLLLREFAEQRLPDLSPAELEHLESILDADDNELLDWLVGRRAPPANINLRVLESIRNVRTGSPSVET